MTNEGINKGTYVRTTDNTLNGIISEISLDQ